MDKEGKKVAVIIGAGPAGLTAAYELLTKSDIHPVILETENFVGGISRTATYKGNRMDIGGHRFFSKDERVTSLWTELMPVQGKPAKDDAILGREKPLKEGGPDPEIEDNTMLVRDRVSRIVYLHKFFDYPISLKPRTFINMGFCRTVKAGFGYIGSCLHKREETNLENFYINRFGKPLYSMFFEDYTEKLWGVHPSNIAADWGAQRVKGLSISKAIKNAITKPFKKNKEVETSLIEQFLYPKKGPGQLYEVMAEKIKELGGEIYLETNVTKINLEGNRVKSVAAMDKEGNLKVFEADYFISSMPIKDLAEAIGEEVMPPEPYRVAVNLPYRDFITVGLLLDGLSVENKTKMKTLGNIVPDCWIYVQEREVRLGRIQIFNNWSPYMVEDPEHNVWIGLEYFCAEGDKMWTCPDEEFTKNAIDELIKIGVIASKDNVKDSTIIHVKKAYPAYFGTYSEFDKVKDYLNSIENLYCVGRNGQHRYNNMDHSMVTSMVACDDIISGNPDKSDIWNVNTEKSYHEVKEEKEGDKNGDGKQ
ncbi:MAG: NAD(P)/FAD-dependent oxidoreductase [Clostridia bacterium]|nr:NAD(P)/FAD-dependent oxidoreductase [Clostridia bacterium]